MRTKNPVLCLMACLALFHFSCSRDQTIQSPGNKKERTPIERLQNANPADFGFREITIEERNQLPMFQFKNKPRAKFKDVNTSVVEDYKYYWNSQTRELFAKRIKSKDSLLAKSNANFFGGGSIHVFVRSWECQCTGIGSTAGPLVVDDNCDESEWLGFVLLTDSNYSYLIHDGFGVYAGNGVFVAEYADVTFSYNYDGLVEQMQEVIWAIGDDWVTD
jgi:hypothetical protein